MDSKNENNKIADQQDQEMIGQLNTELNLKTEELEKLREEFIETERLAFIGQLSAGILHEIKNPLNFVNNFSKLSIELIKELIEIIDKLRNKMDEVVRNDMLDISETLDNNLKKILDNGERAQRVIFSMLAQSRKDAGAEFVLTDINQLVDEFTKLAYQGVRGNDPNFNVTIRTDFDPHVGMIPAVPQELSRVVINIINNGCYALNEKKKLLGEIFAPVISLATKKLENSVEIRIKDNGPGMPLSIINKIFHPFFTTKPVGQGTGLGLSLCFDIVTKTHKGTIDAISEEGKFTEFLIRIPLTQK